MISGDFLPEKVCDFQGNKIADVCPLPYTFFREAVKMRKW